jgi:hypothetical protein
MYLLKRIAKQRFRTDMFEKRLLPGGNFGSFPELFKTGGAGFAIEAVGSRRFCVGARVSL